MQLPLTVRKSWLYGYQLVDADNRVIASAQVYPWHGAALEQTPEFVIKSLNMIAETMNAHHTARNAL